MTTGPLYLPSIDKSKRKNSQLDTTTTNNNNNNNNKDSSNNGSSGQSKPMVQWRMSHSLIGDAPELVAVPTHFYKVILTESSRSKRTRDKDRATYGVAAFVIPNTYVDPSTPLSSFLVPIDALESVAGVKFHKHLINESTVGELNESTNRWKRDAMSKSTSNSPTLPFLGSAGHSSSTAMISHDGEKKKTKAQNHPKQQQLLSLFRTTTRDTPVGHLCDLTTCELVSEQWLKSFGNKSENRKHNEYHKYRPGRVQQLV